MKELIVILGLVLLSGTDVLAANLKTMDGARHNSIDTYSLPSFTPTQIPSIEADRGNSLLTQEGRGNHRLIVAGVDPTTRGGDPDSRSGKGSVSPN